jgi:glutaminyl-tRNA synthetase
MANINPHSLEVVTGKLEPACADLTTRNAIQFERLGYFTPDYDSAPGKLVLNRTITLKDTWAKEAKKL